MPLLPALPPATDETALVQRLRACDEPAFALLHRRYAPALRAVIRRVLPADEALAADVLQEAWIKIWQGFAGYDADRGRLYTWMARVCTHHALDVVRGAGHRFHRRARSLDEPGAQRWPAPVTFRPEHLGLRELTQGLVPRQREIIDLLYFGGYTQAETAARLGLPLGTVKTRAQAALRVLAARTHEPAPPSPGPGHAAAGQRAAGPAQPCGAC